MHGIIVRNTCPVGSGPLWQWRFAIEERIEESEGMRRFLHWYAGLPSLIREMLDFVFITLCGALTFFGIIVIEELFWALRPVRSYGEPVPSVIFCLLLLIVAIFVPYGWILPIMSGGFFIWYRFSVVMLGKYKIML